MRTTINIDAHVLATAKLRARQLGLTLGEFIEAALQRVPARDAPDDSPDIPAFPSGGLRPGVDLGSNRAIQELLDEGMPVEKLR
jgi:hypothetical protein